MIYESFKYSYTRLSIKHNSKHWIGMSECFVEPLTPWWWKGWGGEGYVGCGGPTPVGWGGWECQIEIHCGGDGGDS